MITINQACKSFGSNIALSQVSLSFRKGEIVALIGPSGSGKTTLLKLLNAQHLPTSGTISIEDQNTSILSSKELKHLRCKIAYIPQDLGLVNSLKVYQNVALGQIGVNNTPSMLRKILFPFKSELEHMHQILQKVGIPEKLYDTTSTLSGGQQQRVAVARALFQNPHTILADEPVSSVDPARAESLIQLLKKVASESQLTVIMSIHNVKLAREYFPRIIGLRKGELVLDSNSPDESELEDLFELNTHEQIG